jgi:hypothetical protein
VSGEGLCDFHADAGGDDIGDVGVSEGVEVNHLSGLVGALEEI